MELQSLPLADDQELIRSILEDIDNIYSTLQGAGLSKKAVKSVKKELETVALFLGVTKREALLFAVIFSLNLYSTKVTPNQVCDYLGISLVQFAAMLTECQNLTDRQILTCHAPERFATDHQLANVWYTIHKNYWDKLRVNVHTNGESTVEAEISPFLELMSTFSSTVLEDMYYSSYDETIAKVKELFANYAHLPIIQQINALKLSEADKAVLLVMIHGELAHDEETDLNNVANSLSLPFSLRVQLRHQLVTGTHPLVQAGHLQYRPAKDETPATLRLDRLFLKELMGADYQFIESKEADTRFVNLLPAEKIKAMPLFFNAEEEKQVAFLRQLTHPSQYDSVRSRLTEYGFRSGITILLYGKPGTGKTESVMQIAKENGRTVMRVELSAIQSMWVGESEKNLKALFDAYREEVRKNPTNVPILLFNEADALFSKRLTVASTVGQMHNRMQNILLQELEELEGILIATTNLTENLDGAFERRFLYKIKFDVPNVETRLRIWQHKLNQLTTEEARALAVDFSFAGGQIENISRKYILHHLVAGEAFSEKVIRELCQKELLNQYPKVGFGS
jgi:hypothetical protein